MQLPQSRGPLSASLFDALRDRSATLPAPAEVEGDPLAGDDLHLALYACYELHYRGFDDVDEDREWDPAVIAFRSRLERRFEDGLRNSVARATLDGPVEEALRRTISADDGPSVARYLECNGDLERYREFVVHRSAYQLKEADPHSWAIPRLEGKPKAALMEIQFEEYGSGKHASMHAELFGRTMRGLGLDSGYGAYLDHIPGVTLATVNLMSLFGLHRRWRGAIVGHLAAFEMTSTDPNARYAAGLRRLGVDDETIGFYDEHIEADADHEIVAAREMAGGLVDAEPALAADVLFGAAALLTMESRFGRHLLDAWAEGRSSLRLPLPRDDDAGAELRPAVALAAGR